MSAWNPDRNPEPALVCSVLPWSRLHITNTAIVLLLDPALRWCHFFGTEMLEKGNADILELPTINIVL